MSLRPWHDHLAGELKRQALPESYCERLLEELADHQLDLEENLMSMDALVNSAIEHRLGDPKVIAAQASKSYRRNFAQRWPLICFVLGPLVGFPIAIAALVASGILIGEAVFPWLGLDAFFSDPAVANRAIHTFAWSLRLVPFIAGSLFFVYLARRTRQDWRWSILAVLLVTLLAISFQASVVDKSGPSEGQFSLGLSLPITSPIAYLQAAGPLGIAAVAFLRRKSTSRMQLAS